MVFQILIHIQRVQLLGIEAREEHTHDQTKVERFHVGFLLFQPQIDIIVVSTEILDGEIRTEHLVVVVDDFLHIVSLRHGFADKTAVHARQFIVLVRVR